MNEILLKEKRLRRNAYMKLWAKKNPDKIKLSSKNKWNKIKEKDCLRKKLIYEFNKEWIQVFKSECGCLHCGNIDPQVLCFHHKNPEEKSFKISNNMTTGLWKLQEEISKCDVLCHNCHLELHHSKEYVGRSQKIKIKKTYLGILKEKFGCKSCRHKNKISLQFHHLGGKESSKSCLGNNYLSNFCDIYKEVQKCEILCANCHVKHHS